MAGLPYGKFYWSDWQSDPKLRVCSLGAQGVWMRMLCIMAEADEPGRLMIGRDPCTTADLARLIGHPETELVSLIAELERREVFSRTRNGIIYSRRMVRDAKISAIRTEAGKKARHHTAPLPTSGGDNREINPSRNGDKPDLEGVEILNATNDLPDLLQQNGSKTLVQPESRYQKEREKQQNTIPDPSRDPLPDAARPHLDQVRPQPPEPPPPDGCPMTQGRPIRSRPEPLAHPQAKICPKTARQMLGGQVLDLCIEAVFDAARIDNARWRGDLRPLFVWLLEGIDIGHVCEPIARISAKPGYKVPNSLRYFQAAVDEFCAGKPRFIA